MYEGTINKLFSHLNNPIQYFTEFNGEFIEMNQLLGKKIAINHTGYECFNCKKNKKIRSFGFCFDCFLKVPQAGDYILRPELSKAHLNIQDRDLDYEKKVQLQPHIVYLANSSSLKVGVTRESQIPTRWIDQGANFAIPFARTENRYLAGIIEVELKKYLSDKTNWRKMLSGKADFIDLIAEKESLKNILPDDLKEYYLENNEVLEINYPVLKYPIKFNSISLQKTHEFEGILNGIKGQYLIFEDLVFNWRSHEGYRIDLEIR